MDDIQKKFKKIQDDIQKLSSLGLSKISNEILSQLVRGTPEITASDLNQMDPESIKIILARVGTAMSQEDKEKIVKIISDKKLKDEDKFLVYFIQKLVDIYDDQQNLDDKIKTYIDVCNEYLSFSKKKIIYNESEVEFYIESSFYKDKKLLIDFLSSLSSGEKQILSLFSKIYLSEENEKFYVLFDEPELSLSIFWQERLLPDIIKSNRCENLIVATHSPFVYDNELEDHAAGLIDYITVTLED
ncbi:AAA family ATPase [Desulfobacterales bacterium HSG2]|nr:AAA family ATPase [Desulfobacterales bacterium HSG2]